jgi:hypothetical protein
MNWLGKLFRPAGAEVSTKPLQSCHPALRQAPDTGARGEAAKFLREMLAAGSVPAEELLRQARKFGHAEKTVRRAKADLGIKAYRVGQGSDQRWFWTLPVWPTEVAIGGLAEIIPPTVAISPLAISPPDDEALVLDLPAAATQVVADDGPDREMPDRAPGAGPVPPGFTIPPGVECVCWDLKSAPLKLGRGVTVFNAEDFVKRHLEALAAKLRGDKGWLYEQWSLTTLLVDLKDVGVELQIP